MALGLEWDPLSITDNLLGEVTVTHVANDSNITGGFTCDSWRSRTDFL
jgi:hypothetical protein